MRKIKDLINITYHCEVENFFLHNSASKAIFNRCLLFLLFYVI